MFDMRQWNQFDLDEIFQPEEYFILWQEYDVDVVLGTRKLEDLPTHSSMRPHVRAGVGVCAGEGANCWDGNRQWGHYTYPPVHGIKKRCKDAIRRNFRG